MKFLVFTTDVIPLPGLATSGTALRTWGFVEGFRSHGHEVVVSVPSSALSNLLKNIDSTSLPAQTLAGLAELKKLAFDAANQGRIIAEVAPDVIFCGHWPAMTLSTKPSQPVIIDLAGPHLLERHYQQSPNQIDAVRGKLGAISKADYYVVSGPSQRLYFLSFLLRADVKSAEQRMATVTMPLDPNLPERREAQGEFPRFVFGGVFLPWQDPSAPLTQVAEIVQSRARGSLTLIGGKHPSYKIKQGVYENLFAELSANPRVETLPMLPYAKFIDRLCDCDVALDLMRWNLERQLAVTIRSTTYLWSGVPPIYNNFADLGRLIAQYDAGWSIAPDDRAALDRVCAEIYENPQIVARKSENARRLAREQFAWDRAVQPVLNLLSSADSAPMAETDIILDFPENAQLSICAERPVDQVFVCRSNGLSRVECRMATHDRRLRSPLVLSLYELSGSSRNSQRTLVAKKEFTPDTVNNNQWHAVDLPPLAGSAGKTFVLSVQADEPAEEFAASPWALRGNPYPMLGLYHGERLLEGHALCFRTTCVC